MKKTKTRKKSDHFQLPSIRKQLGGINEAMIMNGTMKAHSHSRRTTNPAKKEAMKNRKPLPKLQRKTSNMESNKEKQTRMRKIRQIVANPKFSGKGTLDFYKLGQLIGQGAFGKVYRGWHRISGQELAIKCYPLSALKYSDFRRAVKKETKLLQSVCHPGVIALYEVIQEKRNLYIITEYASGGSLKGLLRRKKAGGEYTEGAIQENEARRLFHQVAAAVAYLHHEQILHRDLKLENVLLDKDGYCKILDLGFSTVVREGRRLRERCGTIVYMAPEIIEVSSEGYSFPVDIWAMGSMLYIMLAGNFPFRPTSIFDMKKNMRKESLKYPQEVSDLAKDLVYNLLRYNEHDRLNADQVLMHPWLTGVEFAERPRTTRHLSLMHIQPRSDSDSLRDEERQLMSDRVERDKPRPKLQRPMSGGRLPSSGKQYREPNSPSRFATELQDSQRNLHSPPESAMQGMKQLALTRPPSPAWEAGSEEPATANLKISSIDSPQDGFSSGPASEDPQTHSRPPRPRSRRDTNDRRRRNQSRQGPQVPTRPARQRNNTRSPSPNSRNLVVDDQSVGSGNMPDLPKKIPAMAQSKNHFDNMEEYFEPYRRCKSGHSAHLASSKLTFSLDPNHAPPESLDLDRMMAYHGSQPPPPHNQKRLVAEGEGANLDQQSVECMLRLGFSEESLRDALFKGERNQLTACYFLLWANFSSKGIEG